MNARKARASEMLAALTADRFLLFKEAELVALDIPYKLRRRTQDKVLAYRAERPFNPKLMPVMTPAANTYLDLVQLAQRESRYAANQIAKLKPAYMVAKQEEKKPRSRFDRPFSSGGVFEKVAFHVSRINDWHDSVHRAWEALTWEEAQWFRDCPPVTRWAGDFPLEAPPPQRFYPLEETPERARQKHLLGWVIADCGGE